MDYETYIREKKAEKKARTAGVVITLVVHVALFSLVYFKGFTYIYPPPEEEPIVLDFMELEPDPMSLKGRRPVANNPDMTKPEEAVQRSKSPIAANTPNETPAAPPDDFGDIETPAPEQPKIDPRASFPGMSRNQSTATTPHSSDSPSDKVKEGVPDGNMLKASVDGKPNAHLVGRKVEGSLIKPNYSLQKSGVVVVKIKVDIYGNVKEAIPGVSGTTLDDKALWAEARNAAMKTHFSPMTRIDENTPQIQEGTITYIFNLK